MYQFHNFKLINFHIPDDNYCGSFVDVERMSQSTWSSFHGCQGKSLIVSRIW